MNYEVENEKFGLRKMEISDCANVVKWRNSVKQNYIYRENLTPDGEIEFFHDKVENGPMVILMICIKELDDKAVGCVVYNGVEEDGSCEYGLFIGDADARGRGVGRWAIKSAMEYAFDVLKYKRLTARIFTDNEASIKSNEYAGLRKTGRILDVTCTDGEKKQMYEYEMLPDML